MFLIRPHPFGGESLSSWRQRAARANGFWLYPTLGKRKYSRDPDGMPSSSEAQWLSREFDISPQALRDMTLRSLEGRVFLSDSVRLPTYWIAGATGYASNSATGPAFCPDCLKKEAEPYWRLSWRFAFATHCEVHEQMLQDQCPACHMLIWPALLHKGTLSRQWLDIGQCWHCQLDLRQSPSGKKADTSLSCHFLNVARSGRAPPALGCTAPDYFRGLWVISQLLLRRHGRRLWSQLPADLASSSCAASEGHRTIGKLPIARRDAVLRAANWLTTDWPTRFVEVAHAAKVSAEAFSGAADQLPEWISKTVTDQLLLKKRVTPHQVQAAIAACQARSKAVTKAELRRTLEVSDAKEMDRLLSQRRRARPEEALRLFVLFEETIKTASPAREEQSTLARDYLIVILIALTNTSAELICSARRSKIECLLKQGIRDHMQGTSPLADLVSRANELNASYALGLKMRAPQRGPGEGPWFVSRFGAPLYAHHLRQRVSKLMNNHFDSKLWKSIDVFEGALNCEGTNYCNDIFIRLARKGLRS